jgi:DNA-binding transcriptional MerR regulator
LSEVTSKNIIMAKLEEILEDTPKTIEEHMKGTEERRKIVEEKMKEIEEKEMQDLLSCVKKESNVWWMSSPFHQLQT